MKSRVPLTGGAPAAPAFRLSLRLSLQRGMIAISGIGLLWLVGCGESPRATTAESKHVQTPSGSATETFSSPLVPSNGERFGTAGWLTFELYRQGTFVIDGPSGLAWQQSDSYRDVAIIRSTNALPKTYTVSAIVGEIEYDLDIIAGLGRDPEYREGPRNENGCYLLAITDTAPTGHHTNDWWHEHRKVVIDVDNNVWGSGMPHPIFMVYFSRANALVSWSGAHHAWQDAWKKAVQYQRNAWYKVEIERTETEFILKVFDEVGARLQRSAVPLDEVWHADGAYQDYFVVGDPHENYYQGSMKIRSISLHTD